ncbi:MAG: hypothetical protein IJT26_01175 [Bacteroidales bacterium]|nr:hypothetical protein [Bacteroidales bacterium]
MKRGIIIMVAMLSSLLAFAASDDMTKLWKQYEYAKKADRPKKQLEILETIGSIATRDRLTWDFYRYWTAKISVSSSRNWKYRDSLNAEFRKAVKEYDEPILNYYTGFDLNSPKERIDYVLANERAFREGHNKEFYNSLSKTDLKCIDNDYEYAVWREAYYNKDLYIKTLLEKFSKPVVDMYKEQGEIRDELDRLRRINADESEFRALDARCRDFNKRKAAFKGQDALLAACWSVDGVVSELNSTDIELRAEKDTVTISLRNLAEAELSVLKGEKSVHKATIKNPQKRFYVRDTVRYILPRMDDGEYVLSCSKGKTKEAVSYEKYTVSASLRHDAGGYSVYAADYISGRPLGNFTLYLYDNEDKLLMSREGFSTWDFKYLPDSFQKKIASKDKRYRTYRIVCGYTGNDGIKHLSKKVYAGESGVDYKGFDSRGLIFLDRSLAKPGDTVSFKVLFFSSDKDYRGGVIADTELSAELIDSEGNKIATSRLKTGEFGTASGSFRIPVGKRNGMWAVNVSGFGDKIYCGEAFRVDDVVLPTFEVTFDAQEKTALPGEMIPVSGRIKGYSGHNPATARITYQVLLMNREIASGPLEADSEGRFEFKFQASADKYSSYHYPVRVKVEDVTGETLEFSTYRRSNSYLSFEMRLANKADGSVSFSDPQSHDASILTTPEAVVVTSSLFGALDIEYQLKCAENLILEGRCRAGDTIRLDFSKLPQENYRLEAKAVNSSRPDIREASRTLQILKLNPSDKALNAGVKHLFMPLDSDCPAFRIGTSEGPLWACAALYGPGNQLLASKPIYLEGKKGTEGTLSEVSFDSVKSLPEEMTVYVFYFKDGAHQNWSNRYTRPAGNFVMPLEFTRFHENAFPASKYTFTVKGLPAAEAVAAVFDKAMERFLPLRYETPYLPSPSAPFINFNVEDGNVGSGWGMVTRRGGLRWAKPTLGAAAVEYEMMDMVMAESAPMMRAESNAMAAKSIDNSFIEVTEEEVDAGADVAVRSDFRTVIAFVPHILSDADGNFTFDVNTSDKASTYVVQFFAHDKQMRNGLLRKEMIVSVPVEVSVVEPRFLFAGDKYFIKSKLSSALDETVTGKVRIDLYDGGDYKTSPKIKSLMSKEVSVRKGEVRDFEYQIDVPENISRLGIKLTFLADPDSDGNPRGSDAVFVSVPVYSASQLITEAHSSVLLAGMDRDKLIAELRALFVNGPASEAELKEISIRDMLYEALPQHIDTSAVDAVALSAALMVADKVEKLRPEADFSVEKALLRARLEECLNSDGGYGWLPGMRSSAIITAVVLERMAETSTAANYYDAASYLDRAFVSSLGQKYWWCGISLEQYLYVRSLYPRVPFISEGLPEKGLKQLRKDARAFLTPASDRGLQGRILAKTRRALTLRNLAATEEGVSLANQWGIRFGTSSKLTSSLEKDKLSLREYAVEHRSGGAYYPNAVMPWRGLLESELYAHSLLHKLLGDDRVSVWMMVQKETQEWKADPGYIDALAEVLNSSEETLETKVIALTAGWLKPFSEIKASGNGMRISRTYQRISAGADSVVGKIDLKEGEILNVGDKIVVTYKIWNEENRSFVRLTANRPANLMPVDQRSGYYGWRPFFYARRLTIPEPNGYRNVLPNATEYWFDVYPEENTTVSEEFYVTQKGTFQTPAVVIESMYAPHYRANDKPAAVTSR